MIVLYVGYGLCVVGLMVAGATAVFQSVRALNYKLANQQFVKLANAKNLERALKLTRAGGPKTYFAAVRAALLAGARSGSRDTTILAPTIQTAFDEAGRPLARMWKLLGWAGLMGSAATIAGAAMVVATLGIGKHGGAPMALGTGLIGMFVGFGAVTRLGQLDAALADARHHLLPLFVQGFADGATIPPEAHAA